MGEAGSLLKAEGMMTSALYIDLEISSQAISGRIMRFFSVTRTISSHCFSACFFVHSASDGAYLPSR